ncbi:MAG: nucleoside-diphosphate kinase [Planctomycetota bacterium]|jgi:nucleoside-diphosphate kinase|nr:nucleoside-diphosphate kinase [Planctomycetota bacterium]
MAVQRTFVIIKPDAVARNLMGEIIGRYERKGLTVVGMRLEKAAKATAEAHYAVHSARPFFADLITFITSGPLVVLALEGDEAVSVVRNLNGATDGRESAPGTIRGDFGMSVGANLVHGSDSEDNAKAELALWFPNDDGITSRKRCDADWLDA